MRKAVSSATRRTKDKRKDDELPQQHLGNQQRHGALNGIHSREEMTNHSLSQQPPPVSTNKSSSNNNSKNSGGHNNNNNPVTGQEHRKISKDEAELQAKNHRLAKELSEVRVRHREECKHVTRLTMENMNLASRCREAMSHVAIIKKELSVQKKKAAEAIAMQKKLSAQLVALQQSNKAESSRNSTSSTDSSTPKTPVKQSPSENGKNSSNDNNNIGIDYESSRQRLVSEDSPSSFKSAGSGKTSKKIRSSSVTPSPLAAEMDRMDQILAEHQEKVEQQLHSYGAELSSSNHQNQGKDSRKKQQLAISQLIAATVLNHEKQSDDDALERIVSVPTTGSNPVDLDVSQNSSSLDSSEHKPDNSDHISDNSDHASDADANEDVLPSINAIHTNKSNEEEDNLLEVVMPSNNDINSTQLTISSPASSSSGNLVSSDDYEDQELLEPVEVSDQPVGVDTNGEKKSMSLNEATDQLLTATMERGVKESWFDAVGKQLDPGSPVTMKAKFFPYSASPKLEYPLRGNHPSRINYNEEFPEDITPIPIRRKSMGGSIDRKLRLANLSPTSPVDQASSEDGKASNSESSASLVSSSSSSNNSNGSLQITVDGSQIMSSIDAFEASFNINFPDSFTPREAMIKEEDEGECEEGKSENDIYNPFAASPERKNDKISGKEKRIDDPCQQELLDDSSIPMFPSRQASDSNDEDIETQPLLNPKDSANTYRGYSSETKASKQTSSYGNGIRDRATAAYQRSSRKNKFSDPPGKDRTSPLPEKSRQSLESSNVRDPPFHSGLAAMEEVTCPGLSDQLRQFTTSDKVLPTRPRKKSQILIEEKYLNRDVDNNTSPASSTSSSDRKQQQPIQNISPQTRARPLQSNFQQAASSIGSSVSPRNSAIENGVGTVKKLDSSPMLNPISASKVVIQKGDSTPLSYQYAENLSTPERKSGSVTLRLEPSTEPPRPEKQGFDSARARYERALGLSQASVVNSNTSATTDEPENHRSNKSSTPSGSPAVVPSSNLIRERVAKFQEKSSPIQSSAPSIISTSGEKDNRNTNGVLTRSKSFKLGNTVSSISHLFSPVVKEPEDNGDIPMVSKLSPNKSLNNSYDQDESSPTKSKENRMGVQRNLFDEGDSPVDKSSSTQRSWKRSFMEQNSLTDKPDASETAVDVSNEDDNDDIIEIPREVPPVGTYDFSATSRFTLNANKQFQRIMGGRNNNMNQQQSAAQPTSNKAYRHRDLFRLSASNDSR